MCFHSLLPARLLWSGNLKFASVSNKNKKIIIEKKPVFLLINKPCLIR